MPEEAMNDRDVERVPEGAMNGAVTANAAPLHHTSSLGSLPDRMQDTNMKTEVNDDNVDDDDDDDDSPLITLIAKFSKERIVLDGLPSSTTIVQVKEMIHDRTRILPKRQKLVGLVAQTGGRAKGVHDHLRLSELKVKGKSAVNINNTENNNSNTITHQFILMGTPEEEIFVDPSDKEDLPDVIDDFELDFNAGSKEWLQHVANEENLKSFTQKTLVHIMNAPRPHKPLLVLDLDHTLLDFSSRQLMQQQQQQQQGQSHADAMKRPYMNEFLTTAYRHYDLVVWSQTSWRWLETKLTELGMLTHPGYRFCFVLDKTSMFTVVSTKRDGSSIEHHVKPLQIIWSKFPHWGSHNSIHLDDLSRNFALNLGSGLKVKPYFRKKSSARKDAELLGLSHYLEQLAKAKVDFNKVDFNKWGDVVGGKRPLVDKSVDDDEDDVKMKEDDEGKP